MYDKNSEETSVRISVSRFQRYSKAKAKKNKRCHDFKDIAKRRQKRIKKRATVKSLIFYAKRTELCDGGERGICKECNARRNSEETSVRISVSRFQRYSKAKAKKNKKTSDSQVAHFLCKTHRALRWRRKRGYVKSIFYRLFRSITRKIHKSEGSRERSFPQTSLKYYNII